MTKLQSTILAIQGPREAQSRHPDQTAGAPRSHSRVKPEQYRLGGALRKNRGRSNPSLANGYHAIAVAKPLSLGSPFRIERLNLLHDHFASGTRCDLMESISQCTPTIKTTYNQDTKRQSPGPFLFLECPKICSGSNLYPSRFPSPASAVKRDGQQPRNATLSA